jgi:GMP synthase (glutamine-hydrolysing)
MILIINNALTNEMTEMTNKLTKILLDFNIRFRVIHSSESYSKIVKLLEDSMGVILTGSEISYSKDIYSKMETKMINNNMEIIRNVKIPILGICFGFHSIAKFYGSKIFLYPIYIKKKMSINIDNNSPIFFNLPPKIIVQEHHGDFIGGELFISPNKTQKSSQKKSKYEIIAYSDKFVEGIKGKNNVYGLQFHPETSNKVGKIILLNFINICLTNINK